MIRRRQFITLLGGAAAAWPLAAGAQQSKMPVIGYLGATSPNLKPASEQLAVFRQVLREVGFAEGENVAVEYRWAEGKYDRLPLLAADLVRLQVAVICANGGTPTSLAAKAATQSIPIVFLIGTNPVEVGLVASLNRPGGNATGVTILNADLMAKRIEAIHEVVPAAGTIALLVNPASPTLSATEQSEAKFAARALALRLVVANASNPSPDHASRGAFLHVRRADACRRSVRRDRCEATRDATRLGLICRVGGSSGHTAPRLMGRTA